VTVEEMILACRAVRRGVTRALVSCDFPFGPLQEGTASAVRTAIRLVKEGGADLVKLDGAAAYPESVRAITQAGIPVWAQFGITPHTALQYGGMARVGPELSTEYKDQLLEQATQLEAAGAALLDFTNSGPVAGAEVAIACSIPVIGGLGGGPWLDGRVRAAFAAVGYLARAVDDSTTERYANLASITLEAMKTFAGDVRAGRQIRGAGARTITS
jgi:3-methyl-2-oxobutanoate hydroxymethyltransferase